MQAHYGAWQTLSLTPLSTSAQLENVSIHVSSGEYYCYHFTGEQTKLSNLPKVTEPVSGR